MSPPRRILVAEDDDGLRELLKCDLSDLGYDVSTAQNGKAALAMATEETFDLLLLDVMMPRLGGYHVAHDLAARLGTSAPPILFMTGRDVAVERKFALLLGAVEMIAKPFSLHAIRSKIAEILREPQPPQGPASGA